MDGTWEPGVGAKEPCGVGGGMVGGVSWELERPLVAPSLPGSGTRAWL
jgi:hypothetical protein